MFSLPFSLRSRRVRRLGALAAGATLALAVGAIRADRLPPAQAHFSAGECASCHEKPPTYHEDRSWAINHGRTEARNAGRCETCHAQRACLDCHARAPATHTSAFRSPERRGADEQLHVYVGRNHPAACLVCHTQPQNECTTCHAAEELSRWRTRAQADLVHWRALLPEVDGLAAPERPEPKEAP